MKVFIELRHVIAIEMDDDHYDEVPTREAFLELARTDGDIAYDIGNGPHDVYDIDWEVVDDVEHSLRLEADGPFCAVTLHARTATP